MSVHAGVVEALSALGSARQRSFLALVGIVIGVASVSAMVSVGSIARGEAVRQFEELGTDLLKIALRAPRNAQGVSGIELALAEGIVELDEVSASAPFVAGAAEAIVAGRKPVSTALIGATESMESLARLTLAEGRFISDFDGRRHFCVIGHEVLKTLRALRIDDALGADIVFGDVILEVIGVLERSGVGERPFDPNRSIIVPIATAMRLAPGVALRDIVARTAPGSNYRAATRSLLEYFAEHAPKMRVEVRSAEELIAQMHRQMRVYTLLLGAIGAIALLVGGIGVMNVMLVAVAERRTEIGLRRALGARRRDIQAQFLSESVILSMLGGVLGAALGAVATYTICRYTGWEFAVSVKATALGTAVAGGAGVFFGLYPAWQAARLDPVAALSGT